jgi:pimeloyl-ACP methyl ester carboxylesterase
MPPRPVVVVAGSGVSPHEQMIFATASLMREAGYSEQEVARATGLRMHLNQLWRERGSLDQARQLMREASSRTWYGLTYLGDPDQAGDETLEASFGWDLDIRPALSQLRVPVLLVYGQTDRWVPIEPSIAVWRAAVNQERAPLSVARLPGCGHFPTLPADPADLHEAGPVSPLYERVLADWLTTVTAPPART